MIVVFGGTGRVGRQIVEQLRSQNRPVRVATRAPGHISPPPRGAIEIARCDLLDRGALARALSGAEVVVCTAHGGEGKGANGPRGIPQLIEAATDLPLKHFVYISTASSRADSPVEFFRLKAQVEGRLRDSGIRYSILRPTHLLDTWVPMLAKSLATKGRALVIGAGTNPVSWVAGTDIAAAAARLCQESGSGLVADLGGPEPLSLRELNEHLARALGVTARRTTVMSRGTLRLGSRLLSHLNEVMSRQMQMGLLLDSRPQATDSSSPWQRLGVRPTPVDQWLEVHLPPLLTEWGVTAPAVRSQVAGEEA